jgi:hypothetical protein
MTLKLLIACLLIAMATACSSFALGQPASCGKGNIAAEPDATVKDATQFLANLQQAIKAGNRTQVMDLVHYPLTASTADATLHIENSTELAKRYNAVFTPRWRKAILQQDVGCVNRVGDKGFMLAQGALWFNAFQPDGMRIVSVNQPIE